MARWPVEGKRVLVVGASSGIGREAARLLAQRGARLAVSARRRDRLDALAAEIVLAGGRCIPLPADVLDAAEAARMVDDAATALGGLDLVLLNAGGAPALDMRRLTAQEVTACMRSNYDVTANCLFPALAHMRRQGGGVVAHTNSLAGLVPVPLQGPYCAAKAATKMLIDTCRLEFAGFGIRFVTIHPGFVATEATADDGMPAPMEISEAEAAARIVAAIEALRAQTLFPLPMAMLVRLARVLPRGLREAIQKRDVPSLGDGASR